MLEKLSTTAWDYQKAAHLLNRAGFGGTPAEIEKLEKLGLEKAVDHLVNYEQVTEELVNPEWAKPEAGRLERLAKYKEAPEMERKQMQREFLREQGAHVADLRGWWLGRMVHTKRPLQEKLTLFWHGHFATSTQKVRDAYLMWRQNDIFRKHGAGSWPALLSQVSKDPAMLIWLDQAQSRKNHPNENFAREVMELFVLGEGHYTEKDITEAARAFTGWSLNITRDDFVFRPQIHDRGEKTVLGKTGPLNGQDVLDILVKQPQASRFITAKLWRFFASENPDPKCLDALAEDFKTHGQEFKTLLRRIFLSEEFYSPAVMRSQVKSPVQLLVGSVRMLDREAPGTFLANNALRLLGQDLFAPPNVKGWDGGLNWITTSNLLNRYNLAALLVLGENTLARSAVKGQPGGNMPGVMLERQAKAYGPVTVKGWFSEEERKSNPQLVKALALRFLETDLKEKQEKALLGYLETRGEIDDDDVRHAIRLLMSMPEYQLT